MAIWELIVICGILFVLLELFIPSMFFLNFALSAFLTAVVSLFTVKLITLVIVFFVFSFISFIFLRPLILKKMSKEIETGVIDKYIGKQAKVIEEVSSNNGAITIYGERWNARTEDGSVIPIGSEVEIIKNESLTMFVKNKED